jgi:hypothetical protein
MDQGVPQPRSKRDQAPGPQPLGAGVYAGLAFASLAATCLVGYGMYYAGTQLASEPVIRSFYYVLLWVLGITSALFLFGVLRSAASISGRQWGAMIDVGGPAALAVVVVAGGYEFAKLPDTFSLTVRLQGEHPVAEMASGAKLWVDLSGRREHKGFNDDGEVIIQEVPAQFTIDPVQITFESHDFKLKGTNNSAAVQVPANHVINLKLLKISETEQRRRQLWEKYSKILDEISLELTRKKAFLFPAIDRYLASPSPLNWAAVRTAAQDSAKRIKDSMDDEVEYTSQETLIALADHTRNLLSFEGTVQIHSQRAALLAGIPSGDQPPEDQVRRWAEQVQKLYEQMQTQLGNLVEQFRT